LVLATEKRGSIAGRRTGRRGNRTCRRLEAASSADALRVILPCMKFKLFIGAIAFAMLLLAVGGWAVDGARRITLRPRPAV
jgi:hypothetical protein